MASTGDVALEILLQNDLADDETSAVSSNIGENDDDKDSPSSWGAPLPTKPTFSLTDDIATASDATSLDQNAFFSESSEWKAYFNVVNGFRAFWSDAAASSNKGVQVVIPPVSPAIQARQQASKRLMELQNKATAGEEIGEINVNVLSSRNKTTDDKITNIDNVNSVHEHTDVTDSSLVTIIQTKAPKDTNTDSLHGVFSTPSPTSLTIKHSIAQPLMIPSAISSPSTEIVSSELSVQEHDRNQSVNIHTNHSNSNEVNNSIAHPMLNNRESSNSGESIIPKQFEPSTAITLSSSLATTALHQAASILSDTTSPFAAPTSSPLAMGLQHALNTLRADREIVMQEYERVAAERVVELKRLEEERELLARDAAAEEQRRAELTTQAEQVAATQARSRAASTVQNVLKALFTSRKGRREAAEREAAMAAAAAAAQAQAAADAAIRAAREAEIEAELVRVRAAAAAREIELKAELETRLQDAEKQFAERLQRELQREQARRDAIAAAEADAVRAAEEMGVQKKSAELAEMAAAMEQRVRQAALAAAEVAFRARITALRRRRAVSRIRRWLQNLVHHRRSAAFQRLQAEQREREELQVAQQQCAAKEQVTSWIQTHWRGQRVRQQPQFDWRAFKRRREAALPGIVACQALWRGISVRQALRTAVQSARIGEDALGNSDSNTANDELQSVTSFLSNIQQYLHNYDSDEQRGQVKLQQNYVLQQQRQQRHEQQDVTTLPLSQQQTNQMELPNGKNSQQSNEIQTPVVSTMVQNSPRSEQLDIQQVNYTADNDNNTTRNKHGNSNPNNIPMGNNNNHVPVTPLNMSAITPNPNQLVNKTSAADTIRSTANTTRSRNNEDASWSTVAGAETQRLIALRARRMKEGGRHGASGGNRRIG